MIDINVTESPNQKGKIEMQKQVNQRFLGLTSYIIF